MNERYFAKKLADNRRILCASPSYIEQYGIPRTLNELSLHQCLFLKEKNTPFGNWKFFDGKKEQIITVNGGLTTNNGEVILQWALDGHGIIYRSSWDAQRYIKTNQLVHILPKYYEDAPIWAVYPHKLSESLKIESAVSFLKDYFENIKL